MIPSWQLKFPPAQTKRSYELISLVALCMTWRRSNMMPYTILWRGEPDIPYLPDFDSLFCDELPDVMISYLYVFGLCVNDRIPHKVNCALRVSK